MAGHLRCLGVFMFTVAVAKAQGDLSELFSIIRTEGAALSESSRKRTDEILTAYSTGGKSFAAEWPAINTAPGDPRPFVRDQACAVLSSLMLLNAAKPVELPDGTRQLVLQRFSEASPNLRENAVRIIALMAGGVPPAVQSRLVELVRTEPELRVRRVAIEALAAVRVPAPEITEL
jgi:hypothetical protein